MRLAMRHVVSVGRRSVAVVIPKKWALTLGLAPGDSVVLKLNRDRSITIYRAEVGRESARHGETECEEPDHISGGDRLVVKTLLSAYALGLATRCSKKELHSIVKGMSPLGIGLDRSAASAVDLVERAVEYLGGLVRDSVDGYAEAIHEIEHRMDLLFYTSIRATASEIIAKLSKGIESGDVVSYVSGALLFKTLEDLIDSIDRLVWRIQESGASSMELVEVVEDVEALVKDLVGCIRYPCEEEEIRGYYTRLIASKRALKARMIRSPQPIQPAMAEAESMINAVEDLIEAALIISTRNRLKKLRGSEGLASDG